MDNTVTLVGNVTRDPEIRYTPSGQTAATLQAGTHSAASRACQARPWAPARRSAKASAT